MSKNSTQLVSFTEYCRQHPDERFWQALRNWSGYVRIYGIEPDKDPGEAEQDTFYL